VPQEVVLRLPQAEHRVVAGHVDPRTLRVDPLAVAELDPELKNRVDHVVVQALGEATEL